MTAILKALLGWITGDLVGQLTRAYEAKLPDDAAQVVLASAFLIGTCAMWISDIVFGFIARRLGLSQEPPPG